MGQARFKTARPMIGADSSTRPRLRCDADCIAFAAHLAPLLVSAPAPRSSSERHDRIRAEKLKAEELPFDLRELVVNKAGAAAQS